MVYGRLDVYWPDGPIESYRLEKLTVAIGRSSGNDIALETTAVSRYHATITFKNQQVLLEDLESVNGTYVDGVHLASHDPYPLRGGEEIQIGDVRLIFHPPADAFDLADETTQRVVISQPTYRVELEGPEMAVTPGAYVQAVVKIENIGEAADRFTVEVDGLPKGWVRVDRGEMALEPGEQAQAVISFKPLRRSESLPGDHPFVVRVRSRSNPTQTIDLPTMLSVLPYSGFGMALEASRLTNKESFKLYLHNQGNAPLALLLQGVDPDHQLRFHFSNSQYTLGPGERQTVSGTVGLRRSRLFGPEREHEFALTVRAKDASNFLASVPGMYVEKGLLPAWVPVIAVPLIALLAVLLVGLVVLALGGDDRNENPAAPPVITSLEISNPVIVLGETAQIMWTFTGAESVQLVVDQGGSQRRVPLGIGNTFYALKPEQPGKLVVTLEVHNGEQVTTAMTTLEVRPAVTLTLDVIDRPEELVRYVQQDVRISWDVRGASPLDNGAKVWLESPDPAGAALPSAPLEASGYSDVQVAPLSDSAEWLVTLYAEGPDGVVSSVTQKLPIVFPSCELRAERTVVRSDPGDSYPALVPPLTSSDEGSLALSPIARDPSGQWLQVLIGVGENARTGWVKGTDFNCTNFDPARLVETGDVPALPAATPAPAASSTPQVTPTTRLTPVITQPPPTPQG